MQVKVSAADYGLLFWEYWKCWLNFGTKNLIFKNGKVILNNLWNAKIFFLLLILASRCQLAVLSLWRTFDDWIPALCKQISFFFSRMKESRKCIMENLSNGTIFFQCHYKLENQDLLEVLDPIWGSINWWIYAIYFLLPFFLDAPSHLYMRSCPSVRPSVRP